MKWDRGYVDYHALQSRAVMAKPPFSTAYYDLDIQTKVTRWQPECGRSSGLAVRHPTGSQMVEVAAA
jgi:hypothetical protein